MEEGGCSKAIVAEETRGDTFVVTEGKVVAEVEENEDGAFEAKQVFEEDELKLCTARKEVADGDVEDITIVVGSGESLLDDDERDEEAEDGGILASFAFLCSCNRMSKALDRPPTLRRAERLCDLQVNERVHGVNLFPSSDTPQCLSGS